MKNLGIKLQKNSFKLFIFLILGILINVIFAELDSFSFFTKETSTQVQVKAANTQDILEKFEIKTDNSEDCNAQSIIIRRTSNLTFSPTIYFSVEGELSDYILHINPVKLEEYKDYEIKIRVNVDEKQVKGNKNDILKGKITVNYLNEFISEARDIKITKGYIVKNGLGLSKSDSTEVISTPDQNLSSIPDKNVNVELKNSQNKGISEAKINEMSEKNLNVENINKIETQNQVDEKGIKKDEIIKIDTTVDEAPKSGVLDLKQ